MKSKHLFLLAASLLITSAANAAINIDTVLVGNAGNPNDSTGFGQVNYNYHIGTYEVTNGQYTTFLNSVATTDTHGLYNTFMSLFGGITRNGISGSYSYSVKSGFANKPVNSVSFLDAARFTNWLTTGNTEMGVYNLGGVTNPVNSTIARDNAAWLNGGVAIASENEWYKAAYYDPTGADGDGYWLFPNQSSNANNTSGNFSSGGNLADVGSYSPSYYGTFDQGGNVAEWNERFLSYIPNDRGLRGGAANTSHGQSQSLLGGGTSYDNEAPVLGFRVTSLNPIVVPEPSTYAAILGSLGLLIVALRRRS